MSEYEKPEVKVCGISAFNRPASIPLRTIALTTDLCWITALLAILFQFLQLPLITRPWALLSSVLFVLLLGVIQQIAFGCTIGQWIWKLRLHNQHGAPLSVQIFAPDSWIEYARSSVFQREYLSGGGTLRAISLTFLIFTGAVWVADHTVAKHPIFEKAQALELEPFLPTDSSWTIRPYFYSIGAWPKTFSGHPVLFALPYEKGPPTRFIGRIIARWEMPDIRLTVEGPKTPIRFKNSREFQECLTSILPFQSFHCLHQRATFLQRHIEEIQAHVHPQKWQLQWFEVNNPALPTDERPRGVRLSGIGSSRAQDRFILINYEGAQQAFILDRPLSSQGDLALVTIEQAIRSQRVSSGLLPGRAWADKELGSIQLDELNSLQNDPARLLARIADIQGLLLAKVSVDPKSYDAFYHLAGVASILAKNAARHGNTEWGAAAKPMFQNALHYVQDINPNEKRTELLENLWLDIRKL